MREILFRAKSIIADTPNIPEYWLEGSLIRRKLDIEDSLIFNHHIIKIDDYVDVYLDADNEVWPETVGQFTGLLDKNGKKIFEGDIVEHHWGDWDKKGETHIVRWENHSCGFEPFSDSEENCGHCGGGRDPKDCVVIGNIWDNPDILKTVSNLVRYSDA